MMIMTREQCIKLLYYYTTSDISQLFHKVHSTSVLQYMKDICSYKKL